MQLEEIKALRTSYGVTFSWNEQCEALVERMWKMVYGMIALEYWFIVGREHVVTVR